MVRRRPTAGGAGHSPTSIRCAGQPTIDRGLQRSTLAVKDVTHGALAEAYAGRSRSREGNLRRARADSDGIPERLLRRASCIPRLRAVVRVVETSHRRSATSTARRRLLASSSARAQRSNRWARARRARCRGLLALAGRRRRSDPRLRGDRALAGEEGGTLPARTRTDPARARRGPPPRPPQFAPRASRSGGPWRSVEKRAPPGVRGRRLELARISGRRRAATSLTEPSSASPSWLRRAGTTRRSRRPSSSSVGTVEMHLSRTTASSGCGRGQSSPTRCPAPEAP